MTVGGKPSAKPAAATPDAASAPAAAVMAHDLSHLPDSGIVTQLCGDCHLNNFGGYASPERELLFGINGFDDMKKRLHRVEQSVVDLKRDEVETASELTDHRGVPNQLIARIELLERRQPSS